MKPKTAALLHHGGPAAQWGNLGLWTDTQAYAQACAALADRVAAAAGLAPGQRVVSLACGAGEELLHWVQRHGVSHALGVEVNPLLAAAARQRVAAAGQVSRCPVVVQPALAWARQRSVAEGRFDAVVCVDAAYHLSPRKVLFKQARRLLLPGGALAFTDLVLERSPPHTVLMRSAAALCGVPLTELLPAGQRVQQLQQAGFVDVQLQRLDEAVLDGFARFVRDQGQRLGLRAWRPAWLRPAVTAALIGRCRRAGLGYALFSARQPGGGPGLRATTSTE